MPVVINGSTGISGTDGSASTPAVQGTDTNTGLFFPAADTIAFAEGGTEVMRIDSAGNVGINYTNMSSLGTRLFVNGMSGFAATANGSPALGSRSSFTSTFENFSGGYGLGVQVSAATGAVTLQSQRLDGVATAYDVALNPLGGNVGIGTSAPTQRLSVDGNATFTGTAVMASSFLRNRIINGDMRIDQRNAGAATANTISGYTLDRWNVFQTVTGKLIAQQNAGSVTPPAGFTNYLGITSQSAYSVLSSDFYIIDQRIEGFNIADLGWGAAGAQPVTLSFWVRSSLTGTFGGAVLNSAQTRSYPFTYTISAANTWEYKTVAIPGDTTGTWLTNNGVGLNVTFGLGVGSTFSGTAGAWAGSARLSATGAASVVGTNGATFYVTGVQLEVGSVATPFERRQFGQELALCQRYCFVLNQNGVATGVWGGLYSSTAGRMWTKLPVTMRANPSLSNTSNTNTFEMLSVAITSGTLTNFASSRDYITFDGVSLGVSSVIGLPLCYIGPGTISAEL